MKTQKVMDIMYKEKHFVCVRDFTEDTGTYKLYEIMGKHKRIMGRYNVPESVLIRILKGY